MKGKMVKTIKTIILLLIIIICGIYYYKSYDKFKGLKVTEWNNIYNENNITVFYEDLDKELNKNLKNLNRTYKVDEIIKESQNEMDKVLKVVDILKSIVNYDDVPDSIGNDGYSILKEKGENRKVSDRDMALIARDLILISGNKARIGVLRGKDSQFNSNHSYYVVEYWNKEYNKWIMIDFKDKGYMLNKDIPLSVVEIINSDLKEMIYVGNSTQKKYKNKIKGYLNTYSIPIDNTTDFKKSNSYISYIKNVESVEIKLKDEFMPPTIFTMEEKLFNLAPDTKIEEKDKGAYIILMKKPKDLIVNNNNEDNNIFVLGAFQNGKILDSYYANINDSGFEQINMYKDVEFIKGSTKIDISIDGTNIVSSVKVVNDK